MSHSIQKVSLTVNGDKRELEVDEHARLVDVLSDDLGLTGTKFCCGIGVCKACTVGARNAEGALEVPMLSCSTPASSLDGYEIRTVEGLGEEASLSPLQEAFLGRFAFQCGYCTPGFLMAATLLLERLQVSPIKPEEIDDAIADACGSHICRCTGYVRYYDAIRETILKTPGALR